MHIKEIGCDGVDWTESFQGGEKWQVNTAVNFDVSLELAIS
jgi:hypothetical protein